MGWNDSTLQAPVAPVTASPTDNSNRTPNTTRPTLVNLYASFASSVAGDDTSFTITVNGHAFSGAGIPRVKNMTAATGSTLVVHLGAFIVPANTAYKVAKTQNSGTATITYSAEEQAQ